MHPLERFLRLVHEGELMQELPLIYRSLIVAAARRDPARAAAVLDRLADLWRRAKESTDA